MLTVWHTAVTYLSPTFFGGVGALITFLVLAPTKVGERLIGHAFERRMAAFRHEQTIELGKLQSSLDHLKDRGLRSNEREYQGTSQAWERFVEAFRATKAAVIQFLQFPDLDAIPEQDVISFLDANTVPEASKTRIIKSSDKKGAYSLYVRVKLINEAGAAVDALRDTLLKQSVFISAELSAQFDAAAQTLHHAWVEQTLSPSRVDREQEVSMALIGGKGDDMFAILRDAVRTRLLSAG